MNNPDMRRVNVPLHKYPGCIERAAFEWIFVERVKTIWFLAACTEHGMPHGSSMKRVANIDFDTARRGSERKFYVVDSRRCRRCHMSYTHGIFNGPVASAKCLLDDLWLPANAVETNAVCMLAASHAHTGEWKKAFFAREYRRVQNCRCTQIAFEPCNTLASCWCWVHTKCLTEGLRMFSRRFFFRFHRKPLTLSIAIVRRKPNSPIINCVFVCFSNHRK